MSMCDLEQTAMADRDYRVGDTIVLHNSERRYSVQDVRDERLRINGFVWVFKADVKDHYPLFNGRTR